MSHLLGIPVPSVEQIVVGVELVFILYIPKKMVAKLDNEIRRERNRIIHRHVKTGHTSRLKRCQDNACASLQNSVPVVPEMELQAELLDLDF